MNTKIVTMLLAATMVLSLAACGQTEEAPVEEAPAEEAPAEALHGGEGGRRAVDEVYEEC